MSIPIILDTDPGIDDAIAIAILGYFNKDDLKVIVSSYGNINVSVTTTNVINLCKLFKLSPLIIKGSTNPINTADYEEATHIHSENGLGGISLEQGDIPVIEDDFLKALYDNIKKLKIVDYITLGPLTNLAMLIDKYPDVINYINKVVSMGGAINMGNVTKFAEFNIYCDPIASNIAINKLGSTMTIVPLNTTHKISLSLEEVLFVCGEEEGYTKKVLKDILIYNYHSNVKSGDDGCIIHDATAVLYYLYPNLFNVDKKTLSVCEDKESPNVGELLFSENSLVNITTNVNREEIINKLQLVLQKS